MISNKLRWHTTVPDNKIIKRQSCCQFYSGPLVRRGDGLFELTNKGVISLFQSTLWLILLFLFMDKPEDCGWYSLTHLPDPSPTLSSIIDSIEFTKKNKIRSVKTCSETESISSCASIDNKEKSKVWTAEEIELFGILLRKYGTDFHILSAFFPKKTKNQLKNRYKLYINLERKREKTESNNLRAISQLFKEVEEMEERDQKEEEGGSADRE